MITLLLTGCGKQQDDTPENLAAQIRAEYMSLSGWSSDVNLSAEYGEQVFDFTVNASWKREGDTVITVKKPDLVAGITARIRDGETVLEYDGAGISLGMLDLSGLTPVSAIPAIMACITTGYLARCSWLGEGENRKLIVLSRDPNEAPEEGTEFTICIDPITHAIERAEVSVNGELRLTAQFTDFTMELNVDETGTDENLG
jgi:hypothetical protein